MQIFHRFHRYFPWVNLPVTVLVALLQRTPVLRTLAAAESMVASASMGQVLRSVFTAAASLGAVQALAGATQLTASSTSPLSARVGVTLSPSVALTVTGAQSSPASFQVGGTIPPGFSISGLTGSGGKINGSSLIMSGTPTTAGTYTITFRAWELANQTGDSSSIFNYVVQVAAAAVVAPVITTQPTSQTVAVGANVTLSAAASGAPAPTYQWRKDGVDLANATAASLTLTSVQLAQAGGYALVATNSAGSATSDSAVLTVNPPAVSAPVFTTQPASQTMNVGGTVVFNAIATNATSYRWLKSGATLAGQTSPNLVLHEVTSSDAGAYSVVAANGAGSATSSAATLTVGTFAATDLSRLINLSVLTTAGSDAKVLTVGAVVGPLNFSGSLPLVVRAVGPTLGSFGIGDVLADPVLTINAAGVTTPIATNDNWGGGATMVNAFLAVGAFALPTASLDSAALPNAAAGGYTVQVTGKGSASGNVIAEIYDASTGRTATSPRLINLSTLTQIDSGGTLAVGFVLRGSTSRTVLVRGIGPTLGTVFGISGAMADPKLELYSNDSGVKITENDNWGGSAQLMDAAASVGAFALADTATKDAVLLVTLPPGAYSARVSGVGSSSGTAIVEVYELP